MADTITVNKTAADAISRDLTALRATVQSEVEGVSVPCMSVSDGAVAIELRSMMSVAQRVGEALIACIDETQAWLNDAVAEYQAADITAATGFGHIASALQTITTSDGEDG